MLGLPPSGRIAALRQAMVRVLDLAILGLHRWSFLVDLNISLSIFFSMYVFLGLRDKIFFNASFITAHKYPPFG